MPVAAPATEFSEYHIFAVSRKPFIGYHGRHLETKDHECTY